MTIGAHTIGDIVYLAFLCVNWIDENICVFQISNRIRSPEYLEGDCTIVYQKGVSVSHVADFGYITRGNSPLVFFSGVVDLQSEKIFTNLSMFVLKNFTDR